LYPEENPLLSEFDKYRPVNTSSQW